MVLEIRKSYVFLIFLLLHLFFWRYSNNELSSFIQGDWVDLWRTIIEAKGFSVYYYDSFTMYAKFFSFIQDITSLSLYIAMIMFSLLSTFLFILLVKIFEVFDKKYSVISAFIVVFLSPSIVTI